jgi:hypothetical protein
MQVNSDTEVSIVARRIREACHLCATQIIHQDVFRFQISMLDTSRV